LSTNITFNPSKIHLHEKNCDNNQSTCISVNYCVKYNGKYNGKYISEKQRAFITLEITDSKLSNEENRVRINKDKNLEQKTVELKANGNNCFNDPFLLTVNVSAIKRFVLF
jgi:hypothetical protein